MAGTFGRTPRWSTQSHAQDRKEKRPTTSKPPDTHLECPVCNEDFQDPKILPCTHLVCQKCVLGWLQTEGPEAGCPLCRASILSSSSTDSLNDQVNALPTDLAIQSLVDNQKLLNSANVCALCEAHLVAVSCCLQCGLKLCRPCGKSHTKIPSLQNHNVEELNNLTAERLAEVCRMTCKNDPDSVVTSYCFSHGELICMQCCATSHRACLDVKPIAEMAQLKRTELKEKAAQLLEEEGKLSLLVQASKAEFKTVRGRVNNAFDDLEALLKKRREAVLDQIRAEEESGAKSMSDLEKDRTSLKAHAGTMKNLAGSAASDALLGMMEKLTSRLKEVERTVGARDHTLTPLKITFEDAEMKRLKDSIAKLGHLDRTEERPETPSSPSSDTEKLTGRQLAKVLKPGDRVKRSTGWRSGEQDGRGPGTVKGRTSLPRFFFNAGAVDIVCVRWDKTGQVSGHRMGSGVYELELL